MAYTPKYSATNPKIIQWKGTFQPYRLGIILRQVHSKLVRTIYMGQGNILKRINYFFTNYGNYVAMGLCMRFAEVAAKYTPPNMGRANILLKYYYRPIQDLTLLVKGEYPPYHATKNDYAALRLGYKFRVLNTKKGHKKNDVYAYTRGINDAKRASRIALRGLSKYSWGAMINNYKLNYQNQVSTLDPNSPFDPNSINVFRTHANKLPPIFQRLARKSPAITKYQWGTFNWKFVPSVQNVLSINFTITNRLTEIERYGSIAISQGLRAAEKYALSIFRAINVASVNRGKTSQNADPALVATSLLRKLIVRLFDDMVDKYGVLRLNFKAETSLKGLKGSAAQFQQHIINVDFT